MREDYGTANQIELCYKLERLDEENTILDLEEFSSENRPVQTFLWYLCIL